MGDNKNILCTRCDAVCTGKAGYDSKGNPHCYSCCASWERVQMQETGKATLYLGRKQVTTGRGIRPGSWEVTDWTGRLRFRVQFITQGKHNIASTRTDVHFIGPRGYMWWGVQYGENTQIVHCKRTKKTAEDYGFQGKRNPYTDSFTMGNTVY